ALAARPATAPEPLAGPQHLAYLIYTSGSTGRPKAVAVPRAAVSHLLGAFCELLDLSPADRWLSVTTPSFDIAVLELLLPLVRGARLVLADRSEVGDAALLRERLARDGITVLQATPVTWRLLDLAGGVPAAVRIRISGGEPIPADLVDVLVSDGAQAWNGYGPTETAVYSAIGRVLAPPVRIGGPVGDTRLYVADGRCQPVPPGVVGEVYIGGAGVARGYLGRPELTAERFVPDGFGGPPGARMYRTGDLARRCADGSLDFVGRADQQVKIRGFRVEPGEIETQLRRQPGVAAAAVGVGGQGADTALVAYLVPTDPAATVPELWPALRSRLARHLPDYMIPATAVLLGALPTTPSGKLDRTALPAPDWTAVRAAAPVPPRTPTEEALGRIWTDLLGVPTIGVHDNFFALGGHSLTATRLVARIRGALGAELPLRALFGAPTIAELAEVVGAEPAAGGTVDRIRTDDLPTDLDQLTDAEVDALLARLIDEEEG
ncbi:MAG: AMP-binding protein, partial [Gaiellaceae bacterium]